MKGFWIDIPWQSENKYVDWLFTAILLTGILFLTRQFERHLFRFNVPEVIYQDGLLLTYFTTWPWQRITLGLIVLVVCIIFQYLFKDKVNSGIFSPAARAIYFTAVIVQTYTLVTLDFNHFFGHWFFIDRLILLGLGLLILFRPLFIPLFLLQLILLTGQLKVPYMIGYDHVHKFIFLPILLSYWLFVLGSQFFKVKRHKHLMTVFAMSILSLWYIKAGIGKFEIDWQYQNSLYHLFAASTDAGWLSSWSHGIKVAMGDFLTKYRDILLWGTVFVEIVLPVFLFYNRMLAIICSVALMVFHLFVYLFSGILFWQWAALELAFMFFLIFRKEDIQALFNWKTRLSYWALLILIPFFTHIGSLAWFDCGYINLYTFNLVDDNGNEYELDATYFSPYDTGFAKNRFYFITPFKTLASTYGQCTDPELLSIVNDWQNNRSVENSDKITDYREQKGIVNYEQTTKNKFVNFLVTFIQNKNNDDPWLISKLSVPPHMQQGPDHRNFQIDKLSHLKIRFQEKVILPKLNYLPMRKDSLIIPISN